MDNQNIVPLQFPTIEVLGLTKTELFEWCDCRETDLVVGLAIHAISEPVNPKFPFDGRNPDKVWCDPLPSEYENIVMAIENYINSGYFDVPEDRLCWGDETLTFEVTEQSSPFIQFTSDK